MDPAQAQLAGRRLALGITNVGSWVVVAAGGLWLLPRTASLWNHPSRVAWLLLLALGVQGVFDYVGGVLLMPAPRLGTTQFLGRWCRGAGGHTLVLGLIALLSYGSFRLTGGFVVAVVVATLGLAVGRTWCLRLVGGVLTSPLTDQRSTMLAMVDDPAFTGAVTIQGHRTVDLWPSSWSERVPPDELVVEQSRRRWQSEAGLPGRALLLILAWSASGSALGTSLCHLASDPPALALLLHSCWMTLWTFGSLLLLPSFSRAAVFAADHAALASGHDPRGWIVRFPKLVGEDGGANALVQTIFYPAPSAERRLERLEAGPSGGFLCGNLARANLYYSWAGCTWLGRAVHCNVGRPALWVFPPSA